MLNKADFFDIINIDLKYNPKKSVNLFETATLGLSVFLVLFFFRPFGMSDENMLSHLFISLGYGFITFILFFANFLFVKKKLYNAFDKKWIIYYELLLFIIILPQICILNFIYSGMVNILEFSIIDFLRISLYTSSLLIIIFLIKNAITISFRYHIEINKLNTKLEYYNEIENLKRIPLNSPNSIKLHFDNEVLNLQLNKIVVITAWGNYIKIMIDTDNSAIELIKRGKIKDAWDQLCNYPEFYKCHRSYIANINYVKKIIGNSKKSDLILHVNESKIPIARDQISRMTKIHSEQKKTA